MAVGGERVRGHDLAVDEKLRALGPAELLDELVDGSDRQRGPDDEQKVQGPEVLFTALVETVDQTLAEKDDVRLYITPAARALGDLLQYDLYIIQIIFMNKCL